MRGAGVLIAAVPLALAGCAGPAVRAPAPAPRVAPTAVRPAEPPPPRPLAELIATSPGLTRFRALAAAGDLPALVAGRGPLVVLAPTDDAFARLAPGTVDALLLAGNRPSLRHLLRFWVAPAPGWSSAAGSLAAGDRAAAVPTLDGEALTMRNGVSADARSPPPRLYESAGRAAAAAEHATAEGGALVTLDRVLAPRSIEPGVPGS